MIKSNANKAQQIAEAAITFEQKRTGHTPKSVKGYQRSQFGQDGATVSRSKISDAGSKSDPVKP